MLSLEQLSEVFAYDAVAGVLVWRRRPLHHFADQRAWKMWNTRYAGHDAGGVVNGYVRVRVFERQHWAHRIIWIISTGSLPHGEIDHIDGNPLNNRLSNLREANRLQNARNRPLNRNNTHGVPGLIFVRKTGRWAATIGAGTGKRRRIGTFDTREEAARARREHEKLLGYSERAK